jgi:hypothetical protein
MRQILPRRLRQAQVMRRQKLPHRHGTNFLKAARAVARDIRLKF